MSWFDTAMSDTVGVVWRAGTGTVDPWTKAQIVDQEAADLQKAQGTTDQFTADQAAEQAATDVGSSLSTFTLGGDDPIGADPSQATLRIPSSQAYKKTWQSLTNDDGTGCGITNIAGCVTIPSWAWWVAGGVAALAVIGIVGYTVSTVSKAKAIVT